MQIKNKNCNVPNALSVLRILLIVPFVCLYLTGHTVAAAVVLAISGISDALDGFVARHFNQFTELGQMLDPLSDKLTQAAVAVALAVRHPLLLPFLLVFVCKEGIMLVGAGVLLKKRKKPFGSKWYGKLGTILFYVTFIVILLMDILGAYNDVVVVVLLCVTAACMIFALIEYGRLFFALLKSQDPEDELDMNEVMDRKHLKKP